ncbi:MFS transporter [uncultured Paraglaciecola sp.]|uniref:MFS transporter n=1 Tax=uncultured Paraglaciecola sp. TaxID=1765024 RepID=UPI0026073B3D|nr:MFS transporter [uncultured Paraglaciecola sp.]
MAGFAALIALLFDAITDPLMGDISDNWHSKWGRRHPFMIAAVIPFSNIPLYAFFTAGRSRILMGCSCGCWAGLSLYEFC